LPSSISGEKLKPFYFGSPSKPLFGCYHGPQTVSPRGCGVVLCYPMAREYIRFHRAYRQLAILLSRVGFPVLRFDFYGCGDSSGEFKGGRVGVWLEDLGVACEELQRRSGVETVCLVGLRLGGTLAMMAGVGRQDLAAMVLWDPVISGPRYVDELLALHRDMLRYAHVKAEERLTGEAPTEILGFPLTGALRRELEQLDLMSMRSGLESPVLLIETHPAMRQERLESHLRSIGAQASLLELPNPKLWVWIEDFSQVLVPHPLLQSIVSWVSERCP
jgi:pimeloyl-ACP methyl ester carboxylesterase